MAPALSKYAHAVIFVIKANDPRLKGRQVQGLDYRRSKSTFREDGYAPVTVITYLDKLKDQGDKDEAFDQASWATGSSSQRTYFIANYNDVNAEQSFAVDRTALDILDSALLSAERFIENSQAARKK
ncbi:hypothetical protein OS493_028768 [Desmophyllum pertusum]|uniref:Uncharacterized protein n=1 Tax=Desmophyllum pertusum TaxID=174260 RepID=A0A9X0CDE0_9CNID|nr:hypothetical protein OS493_028768 [Desmophyllum pertusum]